MHSSQLFVVSLCKNKLGKHNAAMSGLEQLDMDKTLATEKLESRKLTAQCDAGHGW